MWVDGAGGGVKSLGDMSIKRSSFCMPSLSALNKTFRPAITSAMEFEVDVVGVFEIEIKVEVA